mgnify:CR=1 FL=1
MSSTDLEQDWKTSNYSGKFYEEQRIQEALVSPMNLATVRLLMDNVGIDNAVNHIKKFGFSEEDLPKNISNEIKKNAKEVMNEIKKVLNDQKVGERIREGFKIAIIGPANAGKSSLLNYLSIRDVAIVSEIAGTTRDVIETYLNIDGYPVILADTAGIREAKNEIEKKGISLALGKSKEADLNIVVIDNSSKKTSNFFISLSARNSSSDS